MVKLYLVRHAESMGNVEEFFQGSLDVEISPKGFKQLECLKERFRNIKLDRIYTNPLKRAVKTAEYVNFYNQTEIIEIPELSEINAGGFQGLEWSELPVKYPKEFHDWKENQENFQSPNGESMKDVYIRISDAMNKIIAENKDKSIAVVCHGCAIKTYQCYIMNKPLSYMSELGWADNSSVSEINFDDNLNPDIVYLNDSSHLTDELSTLKYSQWCRK